MSTVGFPSPKAMESVPGTSRADKDARNLVLSILREPVVGRMNFSVGRISITPADYQRVAKAIEGGGIAVNADVRLDNQAFYNSATHRLTISSKLQDPGLIIHECTHAIFDLRAIITHVEVSEGLAYVAQSFYGRLSNGPQGRYVLEPDPANPMSWAAWQIIFDESARLAEMLTTTPSVSEAEAAELFRAIRNTTWYRSRMGRLEINDGVDGF
jgi:hypothetical protein